MKKKYRRRWIIIGIILLTVVFWVIRYVSSGEVDTQVARMTEFENKIKVSAVYVRNENVYSTKSGGVLLGKAKSGDKTPVGAHIATLYQGGLDEGAKQEIEEINSRIALLSDLSNGSANFSSDINAIEEDIERGVGEITSLAIDNDLTNLDVAVINLEEIMNVGSGGVIDAKIKELSARREEIENSITTPSEKIYANYTGVFIPFTDGYEEKFSIDTYDSITAEDINDCLKNAKNIKSNAVFEYGAGERVCKTVSNTEWLLACVIPKEDVYGLKKDAAVKIRIADGSTETEEATVIKLYSEDDKNFLCVLRVSGAMENSYSDRICEAEIIKQSYSGLSVPSQALRFNSDGTAGVFVNSGGKVRFKKVNILYSNNEVAIVENSVKSGMLRMYDDVILNRDDIYEGKSVK